MRNELFKYPFYVMFHPFKGFWELKYEKKGRVWIGLIILFLLVIVMILKRQYTGFIVNFNNPNELNSIDELIYIVLPFFLFTIANWSITTLMDGEGKFGEIVMVTAYSLLPAVLIFSSTIIISSFITREELALYFFLETFALIWSFGLLFVGIMTVHQYSVSKTVGTFFLSVVVMGIIIFLGLLFFSLVQQMVSFFQTIYREIIYRV